MPMLSSAGVMIGLAAWVVLSARAWVSGARRARRIPLLRSEVERAMADARKLLLGALREGLVPLLLERGFAQSPLHKERRSREMETAFPFGYIKRARGSHHESIEIHLDQYKASASDLPEAYRLHSCKGCMRWFSPPWFAWPHDLESRVKKAVAQAASLCSEVEVWFATRRVGTHMRRFAYPIKTT